MHGPTFTGNAIACAAANASLDLFETEPRLEQVASINETLNKYLAPLSDHPSVKQVRIHGAVAAVEVDRAFDVGRTIKTFAEMGVFIRPIHNVVYLAPSFTIPTVDLKVLCDAIARLLK
jgi:adenosylmethionine-8-amino-7-oxononanoate aminotransferase